MPKIDVSPELHRMLKIESTLQDKKLKDFTEMILSRSISKRTKDLFRKEKPASKKPKTTDTELTVKLLLELQRLLSEGLEPTNKELVANVDEIKNAGLLLKPYNIIPKHKNRARRYTLDLLPLVKETIENLRMDSGEPKA